MKWIFRLITLAILVVAVAFPFFMKNRDGQPMMALPSLSDISLPKIAEPAANRMVYKWKGADGVWHYGDTPPADQPFSSLEVNDQTNVIQMLTDEERARVTAPPAESRPVAEAAPVPEQEPKPDEGLTLERALNVVNEAKAAASQMNARNRELQRAVGEN